MTREEAWRRTKGYLYDALSGEEADEIIEVLEQEPCENSVSLDDVINVISNHHFDKDKNNFDLLIHNLCKEMKELPSVQPTSTPQNQYYEEHEKIERIKEIMSHEWTCWTSDYIQRVLDGTEDRY